MLSVLVLHSVARKFSIEDKIFAFTWVRLVPCIANVMRRSKFRHHVANSLVHICMIGSFSCLKLFLLTRVIALASLTF